MAHPTPDDLALIALDEDTDAALLAHVAECRACFAEIEALQQVVAVGRSLGPDDRLTAPHARVWRRVAAEVERGRTPAASGAVGLLEPPEERLPAAATATLDAAPPVRTGTAPRRRWATIALAAAVALVVGLGGGFLLRGLQGSGSQVVGVTQLNALPRWAGANGTATVEKGSDGQRTLVVSMQLPASVAVEGTFEVWMSDTKAEDMVAMGTMSGTSAQFPIPTGVNLATHPIVDISIEPPGDTDPAHSDTSVLRGRLNV